jgi:site-specific DNA-methyltransferase (adenine-specific)
VRLLSSAEVLASSAIALDDDLVIEADCALVLPRLPSGGFQLVYLDPPFNTGRRRRHSRLEVRASQDGERAGFGGRRYTSTPLGTLSYADGFDDYLGFLEPKLLEARRLLSEDGSLYFHIDYREAHYCKLLLDGVFGRDCFLNEIVWAYDYGGRARRRWPTKHDTILVYVRDRRRYHFDSAEVEREPYMAPGLVTPEKAARGKLPTDVWWHTIVGTSSREKTGYPTQKPEGVLRRIVAASSEPGAWCLDFFAGSGTLGAVAARMGRRFVLVDSSREAVDVMRRRLQAPAREPAHEQ